MLGSARELGRHLKNKNGQEGQEGQEGAKNVRTFLPLLALLALSCPKTPFSSQAFKEHEQTLHFWQASGRVLGFRLTAAQEKSAGQLRSVKRKPLRA
jgi:hypothetical protein